MIIAANAQFTARTTSMAVMSLMRNALKFEGLNVKLSYCQTDLETMYEITRIVAAVTTGVGFLLAYNCQFTLIIGITVPIVVVHL